MSEIFPEAGPFFFDLSQRAKFRVRGLDRLRFLNGQITNDLRKATDNEAIEACLLNTKGKIDAHLFVAGAADAYLLDADDDLRSALPARLDRYIIADDVQVEDISDEFALFHLVAPDIGNLPNEWRARATRVRRFLAPGWDLWTKSSQHDEAAKSLSDQFPSGDAVSMETLRIESGLPRWGRELTNEIIPIEANLEERCVDYAKGCYIGQEVISRIKMSGQTNKRLCGLVSSDGTALLPSTRLSSPDDERDAGWITSVVYSPCLQKNIALGFVKRGFNIAGTFLRASSRMRLEVVPLPFV
jgi:tRNA-modifying protein YgfZ